MKYHEEQFYFPCTWYAVAWSKEVKEKPIKRKVAGQEIVIFRDKSGKARCIQAHCPHRGADLSLGRCIQGRIQCPFHGFEFEGNGKCVHIPSNPDGPIPKFAHARSFPTVERAHLIWIFPESNIDEGKLPPLNLMPELEDPTYLFIEYSTSWNVHLTRAVEINLDLAHLAYVHKKTMRNRNLNPAIKMQVELENKDTIFVKTKGSIIEYQFPQHWILRLPEKTPLNRRWVNYLTFTPVDHENTMLFGLYGRTYGKWIPGFSRYLMYISMKILKEDQVIAESQNPRSIPESLRMEAHVEADAAQLYFRKRWYSFMKNNEQKIIIQPNIGGQHCEVHL